MEINSECWGIAQMRGGGENKGPEAADTGLPLTLFGGAQTCKLW